MTTGLAEQLADFVSATRFADLPENVVREAKLLLLDSIGCAMAGVDDKKGRIGIDFAAVLAPGQTEATIFGSTRRSSVFGAAFANGELINALDYDAILPPGHISPYVLPGALAVAEADRVSGEDLVVAIAISHEISNRFGKGMDYIRDVIDGKQVIPEVLGYTSSIFGATAAITNLRGASRDVTVEGLKIAAAITPVNSQRPWHEHVPVSTIKYTMAGPLVHASLTAAHMAMMGHRGDGAIFDDADLGYARFIGTKRWEPARILAKLGEHWYFPDENSFKPYPICRAHHGLIELLTGLVEENDIKAGEIDAIRAWGEGFVNRVSWIADTIGDAVEGQFTIAYALAAAAQRLPVSKDWLAPELALSDHIAALMKKVSFHVHPEWATAMIEEPLARPTRIEVDARGQTFSAELRYPKGTPGAGGAGMTDADLIEKFRTNARGVLNADRVERAVSGIMELERTRDVSEVLRLCAAE